MIVAAAVRYLGYTYWLPPPARHHDVIRKIAGTLGFTSIGQNDQGFLDDEGRFLDRVAAMEVAKAAGQILKNDAPVLRELYSENLW